MTFHPKIFVGNWDQWARSNQAEGTMSTTKRKITVAAYIEQQIALSDKSQKDIAETMGYDKPNVLTMIKQGKTKLPINKVGPLAKALGVDPVHLLRLTLTEYLPDTWEALSELIGDSLLTKHERRILQVVRDAAGGVDVDLTRDQERAIAAIVGDARKARQ